MVGDYLEMVGLTPQAMQWFAFGLICLILGLTSKERKWLRAPAMGAFLAWIYTWLPFTDAQNSKPQVAVFLVGSVIGFLYFRKNNSDPDEK